MNENDITLSEDSSLKDLYPVLIGFTKAILPGADVAINIEKQAFREEYLSLFRSSLPARLFSSLIR